MLKKNRIITNWDEVPVIFDIPYAAVILGVTSEYLQQLARKDEFPAFKVGREWRIEKEDFRKYLENLKGKSNNE